MLAVSVFCRTFAPYVTHVPVSQRQGNDIRNFKKKLNMLIINYLTTLGHYLMLMGRSFARP